MDHLDPIETMHVAHQEGNEGKKIGVKRRNQAFGGAKLLKKQGDGCSQKSKTKKTRAPASRAFPEVDLCLAHINRHDL
jgi:hypothetical protein